MAPVTQAPRRLTIPARMFLMLAAVLVTFGGVLVWSLFQHQRTADELRLLNEGYLPLALTVGEAKATQAVFGTVVDRVISEPDPTATQQWLEVARRVRPATVERALAGVERAEQLKQSTADRAALSGVSDRLRRVRRRFERNEATYERFFETLNRGEGDGAETLVSELRAEERSAEADLREARRQLQDRISIISASAAEQEGRSAILLGASTVVAVLIGLGVIGLAYRMLSPLPRLQRRVEVVARGDLSPVELPRSDDELGRLADAVRAHGGGPQGPGSKPAGRDPSAGAFRAPRGDWSHGGARDPRGEEPSVEHWSQRGTARGGVGG